MLGPNYEEADHKILCIGQIHLATEWVEARDTLGSLQPLMKRWLDGAESYEEFCDKYNDAYSTLLPQWGTWTKAFGPVLRRFGIGPRGVTHVNFARCWQTSGTRVYDATGACAEEFPTREIYDLVEPDAVLVLSGASVFQAYPSLMRGLPNSEWAHFPGRRSFAFSAEDIAKTVERLSEKLVASR